ncbi:hypothetical protein BpHYR1_035272 [Brachionus plicatilis]|uniref:Uncharacterized protein n=1 Tax=Brachionus plicatilis TaxID=10195 RepID=A0A3M7Q9H5_BRAPC|nr:hypothetical protein BpHYR1_035272 [Brachionus plicatilis]
MDKSLSFYNFQCPHKPGLAASVWEQDLVIISVRGLSFNSSGSDVLSSYKTKSSLIFLASALFTIY